jgi:hypothetical protein
MVCRKRNSAVGHPVLWAPPSVDVFNAPYSSLLLQCMSLELGDFVAKVVEGGLRPDRL